MLEILVENAKQKKEDFHKLVEYYNPTVYKWCRKLTENEADRQDIMQEAFIKLYQDLPKLNDPGKFNAWFRKLVIHTAYDWFRKNRQKLELAYIENAFEVNEPGASDSSGMQDSYRGGTDGFLGDSIKAAIEKLSENNRIVFTLFYEHEKKCSEIARMLGLTDNAVKNRLSRAREHLRNELSCLKELNYIKKDKAFRILILCCSHKKQGLSFELAGRVTESVFKVSPLSQVRTVELADYNLSGCYVCYKCASLRRCDQQDGFNKIYEECLWADAIVVVSPYYAPIPSRLSALLERIMSISISPIVTEDHPARAFPLQKKWCAVLNFSIVQSQGYMASIIREPLVSFGLGLILTEDKLPPDAPISEHADLLGKLIVEKMEQTPESNAIDNWFDYWNEENLRTLDVLRKREELI